MTNDEYIAANRALDDKLERLQRTKAKLAAAARSAHHEEFVDASVRQFCATAKAHLQACSDFDANRQFLVAHVTRVIFNRYDVEIVGSVAVRTPSGETKLPFRIEGKIHIAAVRSNSSRKAALAAMRSTAPVSDAPTFDDQPISLPPIRFGQVDRFPHCSRSNVNCSENQIRCQRNKEEADTNHSQLIS
jgi:hypothetical protein